MQAEAPVLEHLYGTYRAVRLFCMLAVLGAAVLLFLLSGGFPPWAWRLLVQSVPHVFLLLAERGQAALLALIGLMLLSLTILLAWWALVWLAWRMVAYWLYERHELHCFAADMQEAQYLAQEEEAQYALQYPYADQLGEGEYAYQDEEQGEDEEAYEAEPVRFWADEDGVSEPSPRPLRMGSFQHAQRNVERTISHTPITHHRASARRTYTDNHQQTGSRAYTDDLQQIGPRMQHIDDLQQIDPRVHTDNLQHTSYGMFSPFAPLTAVQAQPSSFEAPSYLPRAVYEQQRVPTASLPAVTSELVMPRSTTRLVVSTGLDAGLKRKGKPNEDSLLALQNTRTLRGCSSPVGLFVVADGMGGHENGQEASRLVIQSLSASIAPALIAGPADDNYAELLAEGVHRANLALYQCNRQKQADMGTTLAAALIVNTTAYIVNVGDSRVYLYRATSGLSQITRDHSTVARLVEAGALKPEEIYTHPRRNEIYRSLGHQASQDVDSFILAVQPGDLLMLCSDGLWEMVRDLQIQHILASEPQQPAQLSAALVQAALDGGGKDNISVIVVGVQAGEETRAAWAS
ncbi:MAG: protein phosphatase 2C domain-containing protein [Ktedonobacteraceae bacterium]